ncbi:trimethylamine methyltransferase family protein [Limibaculum sp. M0105]|uniref:Methyltransferase n=1 Tax=Thermohalobaculum xanthum TaxID=2753746 RepID=A0A8J7M6M8_9RHOB|nr:trimethylamine methyltransferase family protein [Thermohalobaculum xanthum]MBK0399551.1 trimethylamine methyltransferase family protein [Thermohalobaculum xanthum]
MHREGRTRTGRRRPSGGAAEPRSARSVNYRQLRNPFPQMAVFSADRIAAIHDAALSVLEGLGIRVLLPEARAVFRAAGARVDDETGMVHLGREIVEAALASAPTSITCRAGTRSRDVVLEPGSLVFQPGAGAPHATDLARGRRPGTGRDFRELVQITQAFDVLHMVPPLVEPQDIATSLRHYFTMEAQLTLSDKLPFIYSRGTPQVMDCFEMVRDFRGLSDEAFQSESHCYTIINTNSPRQLDIPMSQGLIDFARYGQVSIVTPFTLMGAMAPITVAGALTLSHAEALAAIALTQLVRPGAPVCYGTFTSNVDMRSGAPAFGTPEHFKASLAAGQLARHIGLPWRCASGSAANINDTQAAHETQFALWGCLLAGATVIIHAAGWLEGGLTVSYEKLITDLEVLQMVAELCAVTPAGEGELALDALAEVPPGGHFFGAAHTMARYQTEFYEPLVADWSNFGTWAERGSRDSNSRATAIWKEIVATDARPQADADRVGRLHDFIARRSADGGAPPES